MQLRTLTSTATAFLVAITLVSTTMGQAPPRTAAPRVAAGPAAPTGRVATANSAAGALSPYPTKIAVLDVKQIFEKHATFKQRMTAIDQQVKKLQSDMTAMQKWAIEQQKKITAMTKGPNRDAAEAKVASDLAQFRVKEALTKKSILEAEAVVYYETWRSIEQVVRAHCQRHRIDLVVRFDSRQMSPTDRNSVMSTVNRSVVYQGAELNITPSILAGVNAGHSAAAPQGPARQPATAARPGGFQFRKQ